MLEMLKLPAMRAALITNAIVMVGWDLFNFYVPVSMRNLGFTATTIGDIMGAYGIAALITLAAIPPITARWGVQRMIAGALANPSAASCSCRSRLCRQY